MKKLSFIFAILTMFVLTNTALALKLTNPLTANKPSLAAAGNTTDKQAVWQEMQDWIAKPIKEFIDYYTKKYGAPVVIDGFALDCWGFTGTDGKAFRIINYNNQSHSAPSLQDYPCKKQGS